MKFDKSRKEHRCLVLCSSGEFGLGILDIPSFNSAFLCVSKMDSEMDMYIYSGPILKALLGFVILISFSINQVLFFGPLTRSRVVWLYLLSAAYHLHALNCAGRREVLYLTDFNTGSRQTARFGHHGWRCTHRVLPDFLSLDGLFVEVFMEQFLGKHLNKKLKSHLGQDKIAFWNACIISSLGMLPETLYLFLCFFKLYSFYIQHWRINRRTLKLKYMAFQLGCHPLGRHFRFLLGISAVWDISTKQGVNQSLLSHPF